jgi:Flp pilus assembly secretin CpaC
VNDRLSDDDNVDASDIEVSVSKGEVTLSGTVASRWEKRRAEDVAESVSGVKDVENRIKVKTNQGTSNTENSGSDTGSYGVPYGSSGAAPVGAFDIGKQ